MAELIAVPFGVRARVGSRNSALDGSRSPHAKGQFLGGKDMPGHARRHSAMRCVKMAERIEMTFGMLTPTGPRKHVLRGVHTGATW